MAKNSLGIYWDDLHVQACMIRAGISEYTIEKMVRIPRELGENNEPKHTLSQDVAQLLQQFGMSADTCVASLSEQDIMYRSVLRPFSDRRKIADTIGPEVESLLPVLEGRVITDFILLGKDGSGQNLIETVTAGFDRIKELIATLQSAGIDPEVIDAPSIAMGCGARNLFELKDDTGYLFLHMGWRDSSMAVYSGKRRVYACSFPYGFLSILTALAQETERPLGDIISRCLAEGCEAAHHLDQYVREVLITMHRIGQEDLDPVLVMTGYAPLIRDLPARFESLGGIHSGTPAFRELRFEEGQEGLLHNFLSASLAIRGFDGGEGINFRQQELAFTKKLEKIRVYAGRWIKVALFLLVLWISGVGLDVFLKTRISTGIAGRIQAEFSSVMPKGTPMVDPVRQMEQHLARLSGQSGLIERTGNDSPLEILKDMSIKISPDIDVVFDTITFDQDSLSLSGSTKSYDNVEKIKALIAELPYIAEVKIVSANVDKNSQRVNLKLVCRI
ncbi:MAG: hypothetical protein ACP5G0_09230 [Desulfomonilia bacterium]